MTMLFSGAAALPRRWLRLCQPEFRIGQAGRNHRYGAVVAESKKDARRQEKLRLAWLLLCD